ncbi:adult-specific rigid cuticular protein 15.5-like [Argiope bruennichi]|uniref:Adult-specific rigid cuticular protein 15.5 like protein n=1 Tax=Argiope bruennichi TaxID=94029 RepID=A0A8T0DZ51_ARGBR|nr:adult-specific rigid cuticular protein 15.5-like [Argiope bruennichi]KAF8763456.1 Adult-specific rigid cuticular protein 15.5 like protein [Argiope bruennichi]
MFAKIAILCAAVAAVSANPLLATSVVNDGNSISAKTQDAIGNYAFNYGTATNARAEVGDAAGNKQGSYTITDIDGRARRVDYVADAAGFRASVKTNEPGTALSAPASAAIASPYAPPVAPVAPAVAAPALAAAPLFAAPGLAYSGLIGHGHLGFPYGAGLLAPGFAKTVVW